MTKKTTLTALGSTAGLGVDAIFRDCVDCKYMVEDEPGWQVCDRPNYPEDGKNWNRLTHVQRNVKREEMCGGRYWTPNTK